MRKQDPGQESVAGKSQAVIQTDLSLTSCSITDCLCRLGRGLQLSLSVKQMAASPLKNLVMHSTDTMRGSPVLRLHETALGKASGTWGCSEVVCSVCRGLTLTLSRGVMGVAWGAKGSVAEQHRNWGLSSQGQ